MNELQLHNTKMLWHNGGKKGTQSVLFLKLDIVYLRVHCAVILSILYIPYKILLYLINV